MGSSFEKIQSTFIRDTELLTCSFQHTNSLQALLIKIKGHKFAPMNLVNPGKFFEPESRKSNTNLKTTNRLNQRRLAIFGLFK